MADPISFEEQLFIGNSSVNIVANSVVLKISEGLILLDRTTGSNIGNMTENGGLAAAFDGNANATFYTAAVKSNTTSAYVGKTLAAPSAITKATIYPAQLVGYSSSPEFTAQLYVKTGSAPANSIDGILVGQIFVIDTDVVTAQDIVSNNQTSLYNHVWITGIPSASPADMHLGEVEFYRYPGTSVLVNSTCLVIGNSTVNCVINSTFTGGGGVANGLGIDHGALQANMVTNAFGTSSIYTAFIVGDLTPGLPDSAGGLYSIARKNRANEPFVALSGWDNGSSRDLYYGGGGWNVPDALSHRFYTANTYTETNDTGWLRAQIGSTTISLFAAGSTSNGLFVNSSTVYLTGIPISVGNSTVNVVANSTAIKLSNSTVNTQITVPTGAQYAGSYYLKADGTWSLVSATPPGGANTNVQYNDSSVLGGSAGFTFNKTTNVVGVSNTLTVGNASSNAQLTQTALTIDATPTVNSFSNASMIMVSNTTGSSNLYPTYLHIDKVIIGNNSISVGSNAVVNTAGMRIGNSVAHIDIQSTYIEIDNEFGGWTYIEPKYIDIGAIRLNDNDGTIKIANSSVNLVANSTTITLSNSTVNTHLSIPTGAQYSGSYFLHANGSWVQKNTPARVYQSYTATGGQTTFTVSGGYTIGNIDVFINGVHLSNTEYTQNGSTVVLGTGALVSSVVEVSGYTF